METATFGAGCFWGVEAAFRKVPGVIETAVGYMGGTTPDPTYGEVCAGSTGHTEVVEVTFDPRRIPYPKLLEVFWRIHDPSELHKAQYKSVIFYHTPEQQAAAEAAIAARARTGTPPRPLATDLLPAGVFYRAEEYHQRYYEKHGIEDDACGA